MTAPGAESEPSDVTLASIRHWERRAVISGIVALAIVTVLAVQRPVGWITVVAVVLLFWTGYAGWAWVGSQSGLTFAGPRLTIRRAWSTRSVEAASVRRVRYQMNGASPDFWLLTADGRRQLVPTSGVERGHSTLFRWLDRYCPTAELDPRSATIRDRLQIRGLIPEPDASQPGTSTTRPDVQSDMPALRPDDDLGPDQLPPAERSK